MLCKLAFELLRSAAIKKVATMTVLQAIKVLIENISECDRNKMDYFVQSLFPQQYLLFVNCNIAWAGTFSRCIIPAPIIALLLRQLITFIQVPSPEISRLFRPVQADFQLIVIVIVIINSNYNMAYLMIVFDLVVNKSIADR